MLSRLSKIHHEFPRLFWVVVGVSFIDRIGDTRRRDGHLCTLT